MIEEEGLTWLKEMMLKSKNSDIIYTVLGQLIYENTQVVSEVTGNILCYGMD